VFKMAKRHLTTLKAGRFEFYPEHQFVQYLLPFFVLYFLCLCKYPSAKPTQKQKFMHFVDQLISSYEQHEYVQVLSIKRKSPIQIQRDESRIFNFKEFSETQSSHCLLGTSVNDRAVFHQDFTKILHDIQMICVVEMRTLYAMIPKGYTVNWYNQTTMFMHRTLNIFNDLSISACSSEVKLMLTITQNVDAATSAMDHDAQVVYSLFKYSLQHRTGLLIVSKTDQENKAAYLRAMSKEMLKFAQKLSCEQLAGLFVFMHFGNHNAQRHLQWKNQFQGPGFPPDLSSVFYWCMLNGDRWKIKQLVSPLLIASDRKKKLLKDTSFVSLDFMKTKLCYKRVLEMISPDETRVLMTQPGEITFVPVKHCRWCGLIAAEKFRLCSLCEEFSDYCDVNYFCSENCETVAINSKHREEHARYYEVKLGFEN
jgi:hypothetical protein